MSIKAVSIVLLTAAVITALSHIINKPSGRSLLERFLYFVILFSVMFLASAVWENRKK